MTGGSRFGGGASAPDWQNVWEADFAALPTQVTNGDGVYVIGGANVTRLGTASSYGARSGVINGGGLYPATSGGTSPVSGGNYNRPTYLIGIKQFFTDLNYSTPLRATWLINPAGNAVNDCGLFGGLGMFRAVAPLYRATTSFCQLAQNAGGNWYQFSQLASDMFGAGNIPPSTVIAAPAIDWRTFRVTMLSGIGSGKLLLEASTDTGLWAPENTFSLVSSVEMFGTLGIGGFSFADKAAGTWTPDTLALELGGYGNGFNIDQKAFRAAKIEIYK